MQITTSKAGADGFQVYSDAGSVVVPFGITECNVPDAQCKQLDNS